jgi:hypothetical protein
MKILPIDETPYVFEVTSELTGKGIGLFITVTSAHAEQASTALKSQVILAQRIAEFQNGHSTVNELELEVLAASSRIVGWDGITEPFTKENAFTLCSTNPFIRHQILRISNELATKLDDMIRELVEYAKRELELSAKQKDGSTLRESLESLLANHGIKDPMLEPVDVSNCVTYLWEFILDLNSTRQSGMGVNAISYTEIVSWCTLTGNKLSPYETRVIKMLDRVFLEHYNKQSEADSSKPSE